MLMPPSPVGLRAVSNDGSRPRRGNQKPNDRRSSRPGNKPGRGGAPKGRSQGGKPGRSQSQGRSSGSRRDDDRRPQRSGPRRNDRDERRGRDERRPDRDLAGPQQWGRIARRGAGNMEYEDPETIAQREEYKQRKAERARREAERAAETPEKPQRPQRERDLPAASDLQRQANRAVARGRKGAPARDRRRLPGRPHPVKDPAVALKKMVGESRSKTLVRRLHEGAKAFEAERFADARTALGPVVKEAPELPEGRELMGLTLYRLGKWKEAIEHLESFREIAGSTEQHPVLADAHRALGNWADVDALWAELGEASPSAELVVEGRIVVAGAKADQGDLTSAIRLLEQNWKPPKRPMGHHLRRAYALADLYDRAGRAPRARELFSWVAGHAPDLADVQQRVKALS